MSVETKNVVFVSSLVELCVWTCVYEIISLHEWYVVRAGPLVILDVTAADVGVPHPVHLHLVQPVLQLPSLVPGQSNILSSVTRGSRRCPDRHIYSLTAKEPLKEFHNYTNNKV